MIWAAPAAGLSLFLVGFWLGRFISQDADDALAGQPRNLMSERTLWCYRNLLFREPNPTELREWCTPVRSLETMSALFVASSEFSRMSPDRKRRALAALGQDVPQVKRRRPESVVLPAHDGSSLRRQLA